MQTTYYRRPEILAREEFKQGHAVIEASAGTGKTFTLEHLVLDLIINRTAKIEEILVVTFTEAATRELRERVRALIRKICDEGKEEIPPGEDAACYWEIDEATRGRLREALFRFDGAAISTIHGFCHRVLSEQAFLGGRLFEQEQVDGAEMFGLAFREEIRTVLAEESELGNNLRQWLEEDHYLADLESLLYRCHREGAPERCPVTPVWDPDGMLEIVEGFPEPERLKEAAPDLFSHGSTKSTFISHLDELYGTLAVMKETSSAIAATNLFQEWAQKKRSLKSVQGTQIENIHRAAKMPGAPDLVIKLSEQLETLAKKAAPVESFFAYALLPRVQNRLTARKRSLGQIDFDDMLLGVKDALSGEGAGVLLETLRRRWKYALVDEFQDTDPVQWEVFQKIFVEGTGIHRLFVIGDPKQAIYGFRGADVHTYELAKKYLLEKCKAARVPLTYNFRSTETLIEATNEIITAEDSAGRNFFSGLNRYDEPVKCGDRSRFALEAEKEATPVHLLHLYDEGDKLRAASLRQGLAEFIAREIKQLTGEKAPLLTGSEKKEAAPVSLSDIYILTRTTREGEQVGKALQAYGIPHAYYKQEGLFQTEEASDVYRLLCAIDAPNDPAARMAAWLTPFFEVPLAELPAWRDAGGNHPLTGMLLEWKSLADSHAWSKLFEQILTTSGIMRRLIFSGDERALTNYLHLFEILQADAHARPVTLAELARSLKARIDQKKEPGGREGNVQRLETDKEAVQILTMHKAKGLEAEVVFIAGGFSDGLRKDRAKIYHKDNRRHLHLGKESGEIKEAVEKEVAEENQRLMYVAITRAKSRLYLPYFGEAPEGAPPERVYGYRSLSGFYDNLQTRLDLLAEKGSLADQKKFLTRPVSCATGKLYAGKETEKQPESLSGEDLIRLMEEVPSSAPTAKEIAPYHRGVLLTSYTRMKQGAYLQTGTAGEEERNLTRNEEVAGEVHPATLLTSSAESGKTGEDKPGPEALPGEAVAYGPEAEGSPEKAPSPELPGGRETGIFLHALLENTPAEEVRERKFKEWFQLQPVRERSAALAREHGFGEKYLQQALKLTYNALRAPIHLQSPDNNAELKMPGGIAAGTNHRAEMSFVYPIPEAFHPLLSENESGGKENDGNTRPPYRAVRGYLQGLIDLVFEHNGQFYLLDWKSDCLDSYDQRNLEEHVGNNYHLQAEIYTLALIRQLGIKSLEDYRARFGGVLYIFLRGIRGEEKGGAANGEASEGVWFARPKWQEIAANEKALMQRRQWGGEVIAAGNFCGDDNSASKDKGGPDDERG